MGHISQLYLSLLGSSLELLCLQDQATIIIAVFHLLYLPFQSRTLRWYFSIILLPQLLQIVRPLLYGDLLLNFLITFNLSSLYLVSDVLLEESMILFPFFFGVNLWLRVRMSWCGNGGVLITVGYTIGCCVFSSTLFVGVDDLFYFVSFWGVYCRFEVLLDL